MNVIIDTGCANISSLKFAVERLTPEVLVSADPDQIRAAERVLLPGVGSAGFAMDALQARGLVPVIRSLTQPVLGICLGMQLLLSHSTEGATDCLDIIPGEVIALDAPGLRLPHMGWNTVHTLSEHPLFEDIPDDEYFYFVHSFGLGIGEDTLAEYQYGNPFSAALARGNFMGVQFHPERSGKMGSRLLKNFLGLRS